MHGVMRWRSGRDREDGAQSAMELGDSLMMPVLAEKFMR